MKVQHAYRYWITEPWRWIFLVFFQPARFHQDIEIHAFHFSQRTKLMLRLVIPMFLIAFLFSLLVLIPFHLYLEVTSPSVEGIVEAVFDLISSIIDIAIGIAVGTAIGIAVGTAIGVAVGTTIGIAVGTAIGVVVGATIDVAFGSLFPNNTFFVEFIVIGFTLGIAGGFAAGFVGYTSKAIIISITGGFAAGITTLIYECSISFNAALQNNGASNVIINDFRPSAVNIISAILASIVVTFIIGAVEAIAASFVRYSGKTIIIATIISIILGIATISTYGILGGIHNSIVTGITFGITASSVISIAIAILGITVGIIARISTRDIAFSVIGGLGISGLSLLFTTSSLANSITYLGGSLGGITFGIAFSAASITGMYLVPLYLVSGPSVLKAYLTSRKNPSQALIYLQRSSLHWDERGFLPLPYLQRALLVAYEREPAKTLEEIFFIATQRPRQIKAARGAVIEIVIRDLEVRRTLKEIAGSTRRIAELLPVGTNLLDSRWEKMLTGLSDASRDAERYDTLISRQIKVDTLATMVANLQKIYPDAPFQDQRLNTRLHRVVEIWLEVAQAEQKRLEHLRRDTEQIENPYKPAIILSIPGDTLFVGRRDIAEQLEMALSKASGHPTFLINGERRIGKSSALLQLPRLLGSRYISVFYNLQSPGIYASTFTFAEWLAEGMLKELRKRDVQVKKFTHVSPLPAHKDTNDAYAYAFLDRWLQEVESALAQQERLLLLAFDEFEKLEEVGEKGFLDLALLLDWFRKLIQFHPRLALLFSGVRMLDEMGTKVGMHWSSYFINVRTLHIGLLRKEEAEQLITHPIENYPAEDIYGHGTVEEIIRQTGCHPFLIQAVCSALIDMLNAEQRAMAHPLDVEQAIDTVLTEWDAYFDDLWGRTDAMQRTLIKTLQEVGPGSVEMLMRQCNLSEQATRRTLQTLLRRDLVLREPDDTYRLAVPIFSRWVERNWYRTNNLS